MEVWLEIYFIFTTFLRPELKGNVCSNMSGRFYYFPPDNGLSVHLIYPFSIIVINDTVLYMLRMDIYNPLRRVVKILKQTYFLFYKALLPHWMGNRSYHVRYYNIISFGDISKKTLKRLHLKVT